ncbi:hypothetical protein H5410_026497 [Solanum commersonii]|uniref:Uncharacterized protein n=1 Tax=Solanum commersonii TaxID=4109 RepID=A0A9J5YYR7_SOLCO|nr:hypothetical protein H5410_026497 [Solanum commersonii]
MDFWRFGILDFFNRNFSWTSVKTLAMEQVDPEKTNPFSSINESHNSQNFSWTSVKTLAMELAGLEGQTGLISSSNEPIEG